MKSIAIIISVFLVCGCSMQYHEKKFYKKGGTFTCEPIKETVFDTIIKDGDTVLMPKEVIKYEPKIEYVPRYVYRYKYLTQKAQAKEQTKQNKTNKKAEVKKNRLDNKAKTKQHKQTEKTKRFSWWKFMLIGFVIGFFFRLILRYLLKQFFGIK